MRAASLAAFTLLSLGACGERPAPVARESAAVTVRRLLPAAALVTAPVSLRASLPTSGGKALRITPGMFDEGWLEVRPEVTDAAYERVDGLWTLTNAKPATDVLLVEQADGVEELRVLRAGADGRARYHLTVGPAIREARLIGDSVELLSHGGTVVLHTLPVFAVDARGLRRTPALALSRETGGYLLELTLDLAGLAYPVVLDPKWTTVASLTVDRQEGKGVVLASGLVVLADGPVSSVEEYDPKADKWSLYMLSAARYLSTVTLLDSGKILLAGGATSSTAEVYDPVTHTAKATSNTMSVGRSGAAAAKLASGKVLVVSGGNGSGPTPQSSVDLYDPATDKFTAAASLTPPRFQLAGVTLPSGKVLVAGGQDATTNYSNVDLYEPLTNTWTAAAPLLHPRSWAKIAVVGGKVYVGGGYGVGFTSDDTVEVYDPTTDKWTKVGTFKTARIGGNVWFSTAGAFLVGGNNSSGAALPAVETMDLTSGLVTDGPSLAFPRTNVTLTALVDGRILAAGGVSSSRVEILDPAKSCTSPSDCLPTEGCSPDGLCKPKADNGAACSGATFCKSGNCVDGVCCDKPCAGACEACTATLKGSGADGACGNVAVDTDPKSKCPLDPGYPVSCKADGLCDGAGACRAFAKASTACGTTTCTDGKVSGQLCNGAGTCAAATATSCGAYRCDATGVGCRTKCATEADCAADHVCTGEACVPKAGSKADGQPCTDPSACKSGQCVDGVCCNVACTGACQACDVKGKEGTCAVVAGPPHGARTCGVGVCAGTCDGIDSLACRYPKDGETCGVGGRCAKGLCVEGDAGLPDGGTTDGGADAAEAPSGAEGGCGCVTGRRVDAPSAFGVALLAAVVGRRRRRR